MEFTQWDHHFYTKFLQNKTKTLCLSKSFLHQNEVLSKRTWFKSNEVSYCRWTAVYLYVFICVCVFHCFPWFGASPCLNAMRPSKESGTDFQELTEKLWYPADSFYQLVDCLEIKSYIFSARFYLGWDSLDFEEMSHPTSRGWKTCSCVWTGANVHDGLVPFVFPLDLIWFGWDSCRVCSCRSWKKCDLPLQDLHPWNLNTDRYNIYIYIFLMYTKTYMFV